MKFTVYIGIGAFIETIEVDSEDKIGDAAWELGEQWLAENPCRSCGYSSYK